MNAEMAAGSSEQRRKTWAVTDRWQGAAPPGSIAQQDECWSTQDEVLCGLVHVGIDAVHDGLH